MSKMPVTPYWLKKTAWFCAAFLGILCAIVVCYVEALLAVLPIPFLILCALQCATCIISGIFCGGRHTTRWFIRVLYGIAILLTVAMFVVLFTWLNGFSG